MPTSEITIWGRRYPLQVVELEARPSVTLEHGRVVLNVRPGSDAACRAATMHAWHKSLLCAAVPELIEKWQARLGVSVAVCTPRRMKTKWGSCTPRARRIRLNTELVKKPPDLLEYVVAHELAHLRVPNHGKAFVAILDEHYPAWREARARLNDSSPPAARRKTATNHRKSIAMSILPPKGRTGLARLIAATGYSRDGIVSAFKGEAAFRQIVALNIVLIPLAFFCPVNRGERALMIAVCLLSLIVELLNSAIEAVVDRISEERHPLSKNAKDMASAAQCVALALIAAVWGAILLG